MQALLCRDRRVRHVTTRHNVTSPSQSHDRQRCSQCQLPAAASSQSVKIQALVTESFKNKPQPSCKSKKKWKKNSNFSYLQGQLPIAALSQSVKIQALINESFRFMSQLWCKSKKNEKRIQTSHSHRASCELQLQARVSRFKLSLMRTSDSCSR
jgi:hypothetical protein